MGCLVRALPSEGVWGPLGEACLVKLDKLELLVDSLEKQQHQLVPELEAACSSQVRFLNRSIVLFDIITFLNMLCCSGGLAGGLGAMLGATQPVKFEPIKAKDTANKNGVQYNVDTLLHCITGMSAYEQKSLEELRFEDYVAGRKGGSAAAGTAGGGLFAGGQTTGLGGATAGGLAGGGLFGQQNKTLGIIKCCSTCLVGGRGRWA